MSRTLTTIEITQLAGEEHAYVLVEQARLRCERFHRGVGSDAERSALEQIHRELGMAGWLISSTLEPARRLSLLAAAYSQAAAQTLDTTRRAHALAAVVIEGEDAVVAALTHDSGGDHMHLAHLHLLCAMEQLAALL